MSCGSAMRSHSPDSVVWAVTSLVFLVASALSQSAGVFPIHNAVELEEGGRFVMKWTAESDYIAIEIQVATQGYAGLGFSPSGSMRGADIILGWVDDDGRAHLLDMHGESNDVPLLDDSQDVVLLSGRRNDTHTTLRFRRPWVTCDQLHDMALSSGTIRVIYAYDQARPVDPSSLQYHDHRGVKSMYLQEPPMAAPPLSADVKYWDVRSSNISLPAHLPTTYWCNVYKFPDFDVKHHYIAAKPLIVPENKPFVHHMVMYECYLDDESVFDRYLELEGTRCYTPRMPQSWRRCTRPFVVWAVGSEGESLPDHVGIPIGRKWGGATYFLLEVHYENLAAVPGIVDNSGLRLYYTSRPREHDASVIYFGHSVAAEQIIPPRSASWKTKAHCSSECTSASIPPGGVKTFSAMLHSHLLGRAITLRQIRNGRELPTLLADKSYDFDYQQYHNLKKERTILPGDHLFIECSYNSTERLVPAFGGAGTEEEMCAAFILVYPAAPLATCWSMPVFDDLVSSVGVQSFYEDPWPFKRLFPVENFPPGTTEEEKKAHRRALEDDEYEFLKRGAQVALAENPTYLYNRWQAVTIKEPQVLQNLSFYDHLLERNLWRSGESQKNLARAQETRFYQDMCTDINDKPLVDLPTSQPVQQFVPYRPPKQRCIGADGKKDHRPPIPHVVPFLLGPQSGLRVSPAVLQWIRRLPNQRG